MPDTLTQDVLMRAARDGRWPSATTVLTLGGMCTNYTRIPSARQRASEGHDLHEMVASLLMGQPTPMGVSPDIIAQANTTALAIERKCRSLGTAVNRVEHRYAHPIGFHGQLDIEGEALVIDIKRGLKEASHALQVGGAYAALHAYVNGLDVASVRRACYYVARDQWVWYDEPDNVRVFLATVTSVRWRLANRMAKLPDGELERCFVDLAATSIGDVG